MRPILPLALLLFASEVAARDLRPDYAWHCRFTASVECGPRGCASVAPPAYRAVVSAKDYWRCTDVPFCEDQPRASVRREGRDGLAAALPSAGLVAAFSRGRIVETLTREGSVRTSFGACIEGPDPVITRLRPGAE